MPAGTQSTEIQSFSEVQDAAPAPCESKLNHGSFARVAESSLFQNLTMIAIMLNAAWICVDVEWNNVALETEDHRLPLEPGSIAVENLFCSYFTFELLIRFLAFQKACSCLKDSWFVFDGVLLVFMVLEVWLVPIFSSAIRSKGSTSNLASLRLLRLLRLSRLAGLMRFFPELVTLARGMFKATESVLFVLLFLVILTYGTSIIFTTVLGKPPEQRSEEEQLQPALDQFGDIGSSMMSLITHGVLGDNLMETLMNLQEKSLALMWVFIIFLAVSGITLLNMLIGVLCKVIEETSSTEDDQRKAHELKRIFVRAFRTADVSNDGFIQEQEWCTIADNPEVRDALFRLGVDECEMDVRLEQVRAKVFAPRPPKKAFGPSSVSSSGTLAFSSSRHNSINTEATQTSRRTFRQPGIGLDFDEFVEQVSDLSIDKKTSSLDVETFKCKFRSEAAVTKKKLETLEQQVKELFMQCGAGSAEAEAASAPSTSVLPQSSLRVPASGAAVKAARGVPLAEATGMRSLWANDPPAVNPALPVMREQLRLLPTPVLLEAMRLRSRGEGRFGNLRP